MNFFTVFESWRKKISWEKWEKHYFELSPWRKGLHYLDFWNKSWNICTDLEHCTELIKYQMSLCALLCVIVGVQIANFGEKTLNFI